MPQKKTAKSQGKKAVRLVDVADAAGVSRWVAGHVLNDGQGNSRTSPEAEDRIRKVAKDLGYQPNAAALLLRGKRSYTLGVLVASAGDPLRSFLVQYLDVEAVKIDCHLLIGNTISKSTVGDDQFEYFVDEFARRKVDGVLCAVHRWLDGDRAALVAQHPSTVFYEDPGLPGAAYVTVDREAAVRLAVDRLARQGRRRIGLAVMSRSRPEDVARYRGYVAELDSHGLEVDERLVFDGEPYGPAFPECNESTGKWEFPFETTQAAIDALAGDQGADAIVVHDDFWAAAMLKQLRARGIGVPADVAVVGYLNHYLADWTDPALTTIDLQHWQAARTMVEMLEKMVTEGPLPAEDRVVKIQPKLIVRESA